jgi:hypothetical protein
VETREVWCERGDGVEVPDALCDGAKPDTTRECNPQPCCATDTLQQNRVCDGSAETQWTHWGDDQGDAADRASCADACMSYAVSNGADQWCCRLYEDSGSSTNWVCRPYFTYATSSTSSDVNFSGLGRCQSP